MDNWIYMKCGTCRDKRGAVEVHVKSCQRQLVLCAGMRMAPFQRSFHQPLWAEVQTDRHACIACKAVQAFISMHSMHP
jgi:hypothetical protein